MAEVEYLAHLERIMKAARRVKGIAVITRREKITAEE
jgi:guanosine-3',5'-bis(diphosphate) 3'-pyrophosphohydrolase